MPRVKRQRVERTEDWEQLRLLTKWPEQMVYELIRPVVLYGETGERERTINRKADRFDQEGMVGLLPTSSRTLCGPHQPQVPLLDQVLERQALACVLLRHPHHELEIGEHEPLTRLGVPLLHPSG